MENIEKYLADGFWKDHYSEEIKKNKNGELYVPFKYLEQESNIVIFDHNVDCEPFAYMKNLNEASFCNCKLSNISILAKIPYLKRLSFTNCTFDGEGLAALSKAPALSRINLNRMSAEGLLELKGIKTLKRLNLGNVTDIKPEDITVFKNLRTLEIDNMDLHDCSFIGELPELRILDLNRHSLDNLDFLKMLPNLVKFRLLKPAANEEGLIGLNKFPNLKEFIYPVKDLSLYKGCEKLKEPGISPKTTGGFEVFKGSKVECFIICGSTSNEQVNYIAKEMKRHCKIYSYGRQS